MELDIGLPGLWVDSGGGDWTIAENPALERALAPREKGPPQLCRATEPADRFYLEGYAHQLRANGVRPAAEHAFTEPRSMRLSGELLDR